MTSPDTTSSAAHLAQAKLLAEVARRVERPIDALPPGDVSGVLLVLWHQAASCAVAAAQADASVEAGGRLAFAAGGAELLEAVEAALAQAPTFAPDQAGSTVGRAALLAGFASRLILSLEEPARRARGQHLRRVARFAVPGLLPLVALLFAAAWIIRGPNLVPGAVRTLSSQLSTCDAGECGTATFHTKQERSPWVRYDFGRVRKLHSIDVENRTDCCYDRALPLIVETSNDGVRWTERVRTERPFLSFRHGLSVSARYLRLRVDASNYLHLRQVTIR